MTSPSLRPSWSISLSGKRAKPRPLSAGGRLATWTRRDVTRSIVSASGILSPDPRSHTGYATMAQRRGFNCCSIFDRAHDFANRRARSEAGAGRDDLVDQAGDDHRPVPVEAVEARFDHLWRVHRHPVEQPASAKARDLAELGSRRPGAEAGDLDSMWLQFLMQRFGQGQDER